MWTKGMVHIVVLRKIAYNYWLTFEGINNVVHDNYAIPACRAEKHIENKIVGGNNIIYFYDFEHLLSLFYLISNWLKAY